MFTHLRTIVCIIFNGLHGTVLKAVFILFFGLLERVMVLLHHEGKENGVSGTPGMYSYNGICTYGQKCVAIYPYSERLF